VTGDVSRNVRTAGNKGMNTIIWEWFVDKGLLEFQEQLNEIAYKLAIRLSLQLQ
jgi:hypothetical protein